MEAITEKSVSPIKILGMTALGIGQISFFMSRIIDRAVPTSYKFAQGFLTGFAGVMMLAAIAIIIYYYTNRSENRK